MDVRGTNIFIGMGSNVGDRLGHLRWAARQLSDMTSVWLDGVSSVYESQAHTWSSNDAQSAYLNAVVAIRGKISPKRLLDMCLEFERERGRVREEGQRWEPRTLDLDILAFDDLTHISKSLIVPHPRIAERRFVLEPWSEIAPDYVVPEPYGVSVSELLLKCEDAASLDKTVLKLLD